MRSNAQLTLRDHGIHRLSDTHVQGQTVTLNFHIKREDDATPAMKFIEARHGNPFDHLLNNMEYRENAWQWPLRRIGRG